MTDEWADEAVGWDADPAARAYAAAAFDSLVELDVHLDGVRVLDFGCGTGLLTERLVAGASEVVAVDTSAAMIDVLRAKVVERNWSNVETFTDLGRVEGPFDLIVCSSVCSFLDDYPATARQLASMLGSDGRFVQWDWERASNADEHGLSRDDIADALAESGLTDIEVRTAFTVDVDEMTMAPLIGTGRRSG